MKKFYTPVDFLTNDLQNVKVEVVERPTSERVGAVGQIVTVLEDDVYCYYMCCHAEEHNYTWVKLANTQWVEDYVAQHGGAVTYKGTLDNVVDDVLAGPEGRVNNGDLYVAAANADDWWGNQSSRPDAVGSGDMFLYNGHARQWSHIPLDFIVEQNTNTIHVGEGLQRFITIDGKAIDLQVLADAEHIVYDPENIDPISVRDKIDELDHESFKATGIEHTFKLSVATTAVCTIGVSGGINGDITGWENDTLVDIYANGKRADCEVTYFGNKILLYASSHESTRQDIDATIVIHAPGIYDFEEVQPEDVPDGYINPENPDEVPTQNTSSINLAITTDNVLSAMRNNYNTYRNIIAKNIVIDQPKVNNVITPVVFQTDTNGKLVFNDLIVGGDMGDVEEVSAVKGLVVFGARFVEMRNIVAEQGNMLYNTFDGVKCPFNAQVSNFLAEDISVDSPSMVHNFFNIYNIADNATITIRNANFNLDADNSNVLRIANIASAHNVTIVFENVEWNYETSPITSRERSGLMVYEPCDGDVAFVPGVDVSTLTTKTWNVIFRNCYYNGTIVTENNFGRYNQVLYAYNIGQNGAVVDPGAYFNSISFEW